MRAWQRLLGWLYRERCLGCREWDVHPVCASCEADWPVLPQPTCVVCAGPRFDARPVCGACRALPKAFSATIAACAYTGAARGALQALKYRHRRDLAGYLAAKLVASAGWPGGEWLMVPVPLHRKRLRERGYNQAELLVRAIAKATGQPWAPALERLTPTDPQYGLSRADRVANLEGAFRCTRPVQGRRILLVDDVLTTGATAHHAALALLAAGAAEIRVAVVARTMPPGYDEASVS